MKISYILKRNIAEYRMFISYEVKINVLVRLSATINRSELINQAHRRLAEYHTIESSNIDNLKMSNSFVILAFAFCKMIFQNSIYL
jgi:hypothetical protein